MSLWLSKDELIEATGYKRHAKQCIELARLGLRFMVRHDGFPLVERWQFEQGGKDDLNRLPRAPMEPNWDAVRQFSSRRGGNNSTAQSRVDRIARAVRLGTRVK